MIIIDVMYKNEQYLSYLSEVVPRVGETITVLNPSVIEFLVTSVDYLVESPPSFNGDSTLSLVTVEVE